RGSLTYNIGKNVSIKAGAGKYYQFINRVISESLFSGSRDFWVLTDGENFPVVSGKHFLTGFAYETPDFLFDVEAYYKNTDGLLEYLNLTEPFFEISEPTRITYIGSGIAKGIDFFLQKKTGKYTGWIGYSLARVDHNFPFLNEGNEFSALHDQRHELKTVNMYGIKKWDFSLTWVYGSGKPYTSPSVIYDLNLLGGTQKPFLYVGAKNNARLPDYHRLDFSVTYNYNIGKEGKGQVGIAFINLYDRDNVKYRQIQGIRVNNNSPSGQRLVVADIKLLGFTPNIFLNFNF
ncbi:MAG: TonB-dependent receptor, partial [Flammeovirgaceae bacterium]|nr:TonB-dependent receptor [Flammeovirgaceae bacterium]